jgi:protease-4
LIDGLGSAGFVAREVIGYEEIVDYSVKPNPMDDFLNQLGMSVGEGIGRQLSASAPWQGGYPQLQ